MSSFTNYYLCESCDLEWNDTWSCACNDKCPLCNKEIEPYDSNDGSMGEDDESDV